MGGYPLRLIDGAWCTRGVCKVQVATSLLPSQVAGADIYIVHQDDFFILMTLITLLRAEVPLKKETKVRRSTRIV